MHHSEYTIEYGLWRSVCRSELQPSGCTSHGSAKLRGRSRLSRLSGKAAQTRPKANYRPLALAQIRRNTPIFHLLVVTPIGRSSIVIRFNISTARYTGVSGAMRLQVMP